MYRVIVVDDEPTALNHVCMILHKKCPSYEVAGTAENGKDALELVRKLQPDVVISDVKMPVMDGIELVSRIKEEFPEILSVIVSGYQDFDYAKGAIKSGVCDYLLKPLKPSDLKQLMEGLETKLNALYYEKRNQLMRMMCNDTEFPEQERIRHFFPAGKYYAAIVRTNGLPKRFSRKTGIEIFSMEEEKVYIYGRDEMESLYLVPEDLIFELSFIEMMERVFEKTKAEDAYVTTVVHGDSFEIDAFPTVIRKLYRKLDESIIIGKSQIVENCGEQILCKNCGEEKEQLACIEYLIRYKETGKLVEELEKLFTMWEHNSYSQLYVESQIRYIFQLIRNVYLPEEHLADAQFLLDDAFYYAASMTALKDTMIALAAQYIPALGKEQIDDREQLFQSIRVYLYSHIKDYITLNSICKQFGVSQTSLSKMFRTYEDMSFSNYLTKIRIEKAKQIMQQDPSAYIKDVAERVGYNDQFYFSRIFRSVVGVCPSEYLECNTSTL